VLVGTSATNWFVGGRGDDLIDGGAGLDWATYEGSRSQYEVGSLGSGEYRVAVLDDSSEGTDTLERVERLRFADINVALDLFGNAGTVAKILGAVFGKAAVANEVYAGIGLHYIDGGMSYESLVLLAIEARLGAGASHAAIVDLLYTNVVGLPPPDEDRNHFVGLLDAGEFSVAGLGVMAADIDINRNNIDLVGLSQQGLAYLPYLAG
jgi:hypothetical protein